MLSESAVNRLVRRLWSPEAVRRELEVFALLDAARSPEIHPLVTSCPLDFRCLYAGELEPAFARAAPYLVNLSPKSGFTRELLGRAWGESWGVYLRSAAVLQTLRRHLHSLLQVTQEETGETVFFRYYDPRVLRGFLPSCAPGELRRVFGPVESFVLEDLDGEDAEVLELAFAQRKLLEKRHPPVTRYA